MIKDDLRSKKSEPYYTGPFKIGIIPNIDTSAHEVEKILQHRRMNNNKDEYMVKWKNLDDSHNDWVQEEDFHHNRPIQRYWERRRDQQTIVSLQKPRPVRLSPFGKPAKDLERTHGGIQCRKSSKYNPCSYCQEY
ncbi:hypothetical protein ROZALSC1DRAFT_25715 [Rozella allomycis CSF55]|uniref:Chromo domain-containing protein n=1 Tax=Rozella allomycis (strain CSF55) TaxID=988480 RepID=A0A4V1IYX3_ROZAC|nr:hypothetical protein ROZALSC1DRAFT_25715 [Rozella allomycis CSF55]